MSLCLHFGHICLIILSQGMGSENAVFDLFRPAWSCLSSTRESCTIHLPSITRNRGTSPSVWALGVGHLFVWRTVKWAGGHWGMHASGVVVYMQVRVWCKYVNRRAGGLALYPREHPDSYPCLGPYQDPYLWSDALTIPQTHAPTMAMLSAFSAARAAPPNKRYGRHGRARAARWQLTPLRCTGTPVCVGVCMHIGMIIFGCQCNYT